mmetsp:Transcript_18497/g.30835  ORF Transcript_18497/g.30835 Transcript_18497/m.30835 type:complete len:125 (-) Transcript_18497:794-1168(-)
MTLLNPSLHAMAYGINQQHTISIRQLYCPVSLCTASPTYWKNNHVVSSRLIIAIYWYVHECRCSQPAAARSLSLTDPWRICHPPLPAPALAPAPPLPSPRLLLGRCPACPPARPPPRTWTRKAA